MKVRVAAVQAAPVYLDREASVAKAADLVAAAAKDGVKLAVFGEAFLPTYPDWVWRIPPGNGVLDELYARLLDQSVEVPSKTTEALGTIAKKHKVHLAMGVNERDATRPGTIYNTLLWFGADGELLGKHRKLMPTGAERMVWGFGDGSTLLGTYATPFGRIGGLLCWENYMPLARAAVYAEGVDIWCAPTWDRGSKWTATMQHVALEGRVGVIGVAIANHTRDLPADFPGREFYRDDEWISEGGSVIVDSRGNILAGPLMEAEGTLVAELDSAEIAASRRGFDALGHYSRPDVLQLRVNVDANTPVRTVTRD